MLQKQVTVALLGFKSKRQALEEQVAVTRLDLRAKGKS